MGRLLAARGARRGAGGRAKPAPRAASGCIFLEYCEFWRTAIWRDFRPRLVPGDQWEYEAGTMESRFRARWRRRSATTRTLNTDLRPQESRETPHQPELLLSVYPPMFLRAAAGLSRRARPGATGRRAAGLKVSLRWQRRPPWVLGGKRRCRQQAIGSMTEYWVSKDRYWCKHCRCWMADNPSVRPSNTTQSTLAPLEGHVRLINLR